MQEFIVVQCHSCSIFQVHQIRKDGKFVCKMCGIKQSKKKVYAIGNARDCRIMVQQLNIDTQSENESSLSQFFNDRVEENCSKTNCLSVSSTPVTSKWNKFLDSNIEDEVNINENVNVTRITTGNLSNLCNNIDELHSTAQLCGKGSYKVVSKKRRTEAKEDTSGKSILKEIEKEESLQEVNFSLFDVDLFSSQYSPLHPSSKRMKISASSKSEFDDENLSKNGLSAVGSSLEKYRQLDDNLLDDLNI